MEHCDQGPILCLRVVLWLRSFIVIFAPGSLGFTPSRKHLNCETTQDSLCSAYDSVLIPGL